MSNFLTQIFSEHNFIIRRSSDFLEHQEKFGPVLMQIRGVQDPKDVMISLIVNSSMVDKQLNPLSTEAKKVIVDNLVDPNNLSGRQKIEDFVECVSSRMDSFFISVKRTEQLGYEARTCAQNENIKAFWNSVKDSTIDSYTALLQNITCNIIASDRTFFETIFNFSKISEIATFCCCQHKIVAVVGFSFFAHALYYILRTEGSFIRFLERCILASIHKSEDVLGRARRLTLHYGRKTFLTGIPFLSGVGLINICRPGFAVFFQGPESRKEILKKLIEQTMRSASEIFHFAGKVVVAWPTRAFGEGLLEGLREKYRK